MWEKYIRVLYKITITEIFYFTLMYLSFCRKIQFEIKCHIYMCSHIFTSSYMTVAALHKNLTRPKPWNITVELAHQPVYILHHLPQFGPFLFGAAKEWARRASRYWWERECGALPTNPTVIVPNKSPDPPPILPELAYNPSPNLNKYKEFDPFHL